MDTRTLEIMELDEMRRRIEEDPEEARHLIEVTGDPEALDEMRAQMLRLREELKADVGERFESQVRGLQ